MTGVNAVLFREHNALLAEFLTAVAEDLRMLATLHNAEPDGTLLCALQSVQFPEGLGMKLTSEAAQKARQLLRHALQTLPEPLDEKILDELAADYANIYLTHGIQASPCESVWFDDENLVCQHAMFQVRAYYERHGLAAQDWRIREDDHLVLQLQFLAYLFDSGKSTNVLVEATKFMDEHLLRWLGKFARRVVQRCATDYFAGVAWLTSAYCDELRDVLAEIMGESRPTTEEIEERMKPKREVLPVPVKYVPGIGPSW